MHVYYALKAGRGTLPRAEYALSVLLEGLGVKGIRTSHVARADLVYGPTPPAGGMAVWIPADEWGGDEPSPISFEGTTVYCAGRHPCTGRCVGVDLLRAVDHVISGRLEAAFPVNDWGVPVTGGDPGPMAAPLVAHYADILERHLRRRFGPDWRPAPRWPSGKRYAVVLSHDVDMPFTRPSDRFYRTRLLRDVRRRSYGEALRGLAGWGRAWCRYGSTPSPERDPNFAFEAWQTVEKALGATSAFYVATTSSACPGGAPLDVAYDFRHPAMVRAMNEAVERGWEIGLHASLEAWRHPARLAEEKERLESVLGGYRVVGVRHHHWATAPGQPEATWRAHAAAGFRYDSSLGLNDAPGFRRGMAWSFRPFDPATGRTMALWQVPPTLMDGGIFYHDIPEAEAERRLRRHIRQVFEVGGAVVLDWHLEQMNPARLRGAGAVLTRVLTDLLADDHIYWTSPVGLMRWWEQRLRRVSAAPRLRRPAPTPEAVALRPGAGTV